MAQANPLAAVGNIYKTPELWQKITFTFLCLVIYRLGSHVTAPGVNVNAMVAFFQSQGGGLLGLYDLFVGGNLSRSTIFASSLCGALVSTCSVRWLTSTMSVSPSQRPTE